MLPFLRSQKLFVLKPGVDSQAAVHPERFHASRQPNGEDRANDPTEPDGKFWEELPRSDLLAGSFNGQNLRRVALTTDAGLGKTYNLHWLRHEFNGGTRRLSAFLLPIGKLASPSDLIEKWLVPEVRSAPGNEAEDPERLKADLERLRYRGQLVLLFDGLDMARDENVEALARLLEPQGEWGGCRIVIAGRPFALERHWDRLFADRAWQFVQIAEFNSEQQRAALGKHWFWRYASEMPDEAIRPATTKPPTAWQDTMAPLYDGSAKDTSGRPIRSTEFICRSWERMDRWRAASLVKFMAEFPSLRAEDHDVERQQLVQKLVAEGAFIPLVKSGKPGDTGTFQMGAPEDECPEWDRVGDQQDNPVHDVTLSPFCLHRYCVTNQEYELFDPRHQSRRWLGTHPSVKRDGEGADASCPAVNVSWYDAWCFAQWLGEVTVDGVHYRVQLPTEAQWEYGCRAGQETPFSFHEGQPGTSCTPDVCNFDGNRPWPEGAKMPEGAKTEIYRKRTLPVDGFPSNRWGFFQMHGNVWEWCLDWYAADFYNSEDGHLADPCNEEMAPHRVLRGGSWYDFGWNCRSAYRYGYAPDYRYQHYGFRLAAVPVRAKPDGQ
jgi:formylglycine-generating enzyme required for sulfatase activity